MPDVTLSDLENETAYPVVIANHSGLIVHVNEAFERVFQWSSAEILGVPVTAIIPGRLRDAHHLGFSRFLMTESPTLLGRPLRLRAVRKDGTELDAEHVILAEKRDGQWTFGARIRPIGEP